MTQHGPKTPIQRFDVDLHQLPVAALATHDGMLVAVNRAFETLTGWSAGDVIGRSAPVLVGKLVAASDRDALFHLAANRKSALPQREGRIWCRIVTASGEERPMRVEWRIDDNGRDSVVTLMDAHPEALGQDVTSALARAAGALSRCASEQEVLVKAEETLCARGFTASVLLFDQDGELPRAARSESADPARHTVHSTLFVDNAPYGALIVTSDALNPLIATALDLFAELVGKAVENIRLRKERVERERLAALGEAAGLMAHEVRNPVGSIMNALVLLKREGHASAAAQALLSIIAEESARLEHVVTQLLDLGRPLTPRPRNFALEELSERAVHVLETRGELAGRSIEMPKANETLAWMDPDLLELALVNVLRNAVQSTKPEARVRIWIERSETAVRWSVEDEGPGIPGEVAKRLGQPFVTTRATGTGMGLAVVRRIMEASDGHLSVERGQLGGAQVTLELPHPREGS